MFTIQQYINHAYRQVAVAPSIGRAGLAAQALAQSAEKNGSSSRFRVLSPRGKIVLKGRVTERGVEFD